MVSVCRGGISVTTVSSRTDVIECDTAHTETYPAVFARIGDTPLGQPRPRFVRIQDTMVSDGGRSERLYFLVSLLYTR